jgi:dTDP-4-dehydrorhamnose reductase
MRILVTGSDGLVGTNIIPLLEREFEVIPAFERDWDICDRTKGQEMLSQVSPQVLLNLAAVTNVDGCEDHPDIAYRVNGEGPAVLADICREHKVKLVHLSTDYVFDGTKGTPYTEDDAPNPLSVYGASKLAGERAIMAGDAANLIVRTEWIYGKGGNNFIEKVTKIAREQGSVTVVDDQTGTPTYARDLALPLARLVEHGASGIYHVTNGGYCTWFDFAREIFSLLRLDVVCTPTDSRQLARKANRPAWSVLDCTKLEAKTGHHMRDWREALEQYLGGSE